MSRAVIFNPFTGNFDYISELTLTDVGSTPNAQGASLSGQALTLQPANTSFPGVLLAADWNTFNNKQPAGNYITALTGDGSASGPGSAALTLATVNSNVGAFGSASSVATFTVNAKGLTTAAGSTSIQIAESQVTNLVSDLAGKQATGNYITALTGDVVASGPGSVAATIQASVVSNAKLATMVDQTFKGNVSGSTTNPSDLTVAQMKTALNLTGTNSGDVTLAAVGAVPNANGASLSAQVLTLQPANGSFPGVVTTAAQTFAGVKTFSSPPLLSSLTASLPLKLDASKNVLAAAIDLTGTEVTGSLPIGKGGTGQATKAAGFDALSPMTTSGDIIYGGASGTGTRLAKGSDGQVLTLASGLPTWAAGGSGVTGAYYQGVTTAAARWTGTATSFGDPAIVSGSNTLVQRKGNGITVTAAAGNLAGITWTPSSATAVYLVTAITGMHNSSAGQSVSALLTDGTNPVAGQSIQEGTSDTSAIFVMTLSGVYAPATASAVTLKLQMAVSGGTGDFRDIGGLVGSIQWTIVQIVP